MIYDRCRSRCKWCLCIELASRIFGERKKNTDDIIELFTTKKNLFQINICPQMISSLRSRDKFIAFTSISIHICVRDLFSSCSCSSHSFLRSPFSIPHMIHIYFSFWLLGNVYLFWIYCLHIFPINMIHKTLWKGKNLHHFGICKTFWCRMNTSMKSKWSWRCNFSMLKTQELGSIFKWYFSFFFPSLCFIGKRNCVSFFFLVRNVLCLAYKHF